MCSDLPDPVNGRVAFAPDTLAPFHLDTIATYECDTGFGLSGGHKRVCDIADSIASWSGNVPFCECELHCNCSPQKKQLFSDSKPA